MAVFSIAFNRLVKLEGGFVNDKDDRGGATMLGVSSAFLNSIDDSVILNILDKNKDSIIDEKEIKQIDIPLAYMIYNIYFWEDNKYYLLESQQLANHIFDFAVNAGSKRANLIMQHSINEILEDINENAIATDGIIGPITIEHINDLQEILPEVFCDNRIKFYKALTKKNAKNKKFLKGWINRAKHD